jgi:hypothetical protein
MKGPQNKMVRLTALGECTVCDIVNNDNDNDDSTSGDNENAPKPGTPTIN